MRKEAAGDLAYLTARCKLIPEAGRLTSIHFCHRKVILHEERDTFFHRTMTILAIKAGIMNPGNLVLFDAKTLPSNNFKKA